MTTLDLAIPAILSLVLGLLALAWQWNRRWSRNLPLARKYRDRFFEAAEQLIADERTPEPLVRMLSLMAAGMTRRTLPYFVALKSPPPPPKGVEVIHLDDLPADISQRAVKAIVSGICAMSYLNVLMGPLIRRRLCLDGEASKKDGPVPRRVENRKVERWARLVAQFEQDHERRLTPQPTG